MKERNIVIIIVIILAILGLAAFYFSIVYSGFNFYKSEISINGKIIDEKLSYKPDKPYHTLYRNFQSPIFFIASGNLLAYGNSIGIKSVDCQQGQAYIRLSESYDSACYHFPVTNHAACLPYTEPNEYGCSFGNVYGFKKGQDYKVESQYELYPENLFKINNKYYIKFIVYSSGNHKLLIKGNNFILPSNIVSKKYYFPGDDVIIYAPYPPEGMNIVEQKNFEFDTNYFKKTLAVIVCLIPGMIFFFFWFFFGKENIEPDMPEELSMAPNKRKAWEVAAYFNPPFSGIDRNFFASLMLDLYKRKIIDLKMIEQKSILSTKKELFIKINKVSGGLDEVEKKFIGLLQNVSDSCAKKYKKEDYFNIESVMKVQSVKLDLKDKYEELRKVVEDNGKQYLDKKIIAMVLLFALGGFVFFILAGISGGFFAIFLYILTIILIGVILAKSALLIKFKEDYYKEYKHWQAFKKYLSHSYTIKSATHKTIVMWEEYLLYATALGIPQKILKQGEKIGLVDDKQRGIYAGVYHSSGLVSSGQHVSTGHGGGGGGFGGAGGGGVGGGGGGGR